MGSVIRVHYDALYNSQHILYEGRICCRSAMQNVRCCSRLDGNKQQSAGQLHFIAQIPL